MAPIAVADARRRDLSLRVSTPFSLFDGDRVNRLFGAIGLPGRRARPYRRAHCGPVRPDLAAVGGLRAGRGPVRIKIEGQIFADFAAYAQFWIGLPLFVISERIISRNTREAARTSSTPACCPERPAESRRRHPRSGTAAHLRSRRADPRPARVFHAIASFLPEMLGAGFQTWHTTDRRLTGAGWWAMLVTLPILNYTWLRLGWKTLIWTRFLYRMSRLRLTLVAAHPDRTGGIGFISEVQAKFALFIFAYGISNVAAMVAYKSSGRRQRPAYAADHRIDGRIHHRCTAAVHDAAADVLKTVFRTGGARSPSIVNRRRARPSPSKSAGSTPTPPYRLGQKWPS